MKALKYILFLAVAMAMLKYHANIAYLLGVGGRVVPAGTSLQRYYDESRKEVVEFRMEEIEGRMAILHKIAIDPKENIQVRESALAELEKLKTRAEDATGVTSAKEKVRGGVGKLFDSSLPPEIQARLHSLQKIGWSGGDANNGTTNVSWYPVTNVDVADDTLIIRYPWKQGVLRGSLKDFAYKGEWLQANGSGKFELKFNSDFTRADGWWSPGKKPSERWFFALK